MKRLVLAACVAATWMTIGSQADAQIVRRIIRGVPMNCANGVCTPTAQAFAPQAQQFYAAPQTIQYYEAPVTYSQPVQVRRAAPQMFAQRPRRAWGMWNR